jgi:PAS domain S-box-containing protein
MVQDLMGNKIEPRGTPEHRPPNAAAARVILEHPWFLLAAIVDSCQDAIISKDLNGIITSWNPAATRMFGYQPEEMIGQAVLRLIPPETHYEEDEILRKIRAGEQIERYEAVRVAKDGHRLEVSLTISPIRDNEGRIIGASKIAQDISERKNIEKLLMQSEKLAATGRMAATIAHEINNPLEAVMNLVFLAKRASAEGSDAHGYLLTAESEIERVSHIARLTLGYYRDPGVPCQVQLSALTEEVLTVYKSKFTTREIGVKREFETSRPLLANKGELVQVLSNIIANSVDAMPHGGTLRIQIREPADLDGIRVVIDDQGSGIEERHLSRIFEPFFTTKQDMGNGIGLWVTKRLIENRGGSITVTSSTAPGASGTRVSVYLPFDYVPVPNSPRPHFVTVR